MQDASRTENGDVGEARDGVSWMNLESGKSPDDRRVVMVKCVCALYCVNHIRHQVKRPTFRLVQCAVRAAECK